MSQGNLEVGDSNWLIHIRNHAALLSLGLRMRIPKGRYQHNRAAGYESLKISNKLEASSRHFKIGNNEIGGKGLKLIQSIFSITRFNDATALFLKFIH